jgi:DNA polymerase
LPRRANGSDSATPVYRAPVDDFVFLDFETRNTGGVDLGTVGARRYAADPSTEVLCLTYQRAGGEPQLWLPNGDDAPLRALARDFGVRFVCFGEFEIAIWDLILSWRYGFPAIDMGRWHDARAVCSYLALPRKLEKVLPIVGAPVAKDTEGRRLVLSLSRPNRKTGAYPELSPVVINRVAEYNCLDVAGLIAVHAATGDLPERERRVWLLDQKVNHRGIAVDTNFVRGAKTIADNASGNLFAEFSELTGGLSPPRSTRPGNG